MQIMNMPQHVTGSPAALAFCVKRSLREAGVNAWFLTEVATPERAAALADTVASVPGVTLHHVTGAGPTLGQGECAIITRDSFYPTIHEVQTIQTSSGGGKARLSRATYSLAVVAETVHGHLDALAADHTFAHVEGIFAKLPLPQRIKARFLLRHNRTRIKTYLAGVHATRAGVMALAAKYHADDVIYAPDGNLDAHKKWVRQLLARAWPGMNLAVTKAPDLGRRAVGWVLTTMTPGKSRVVKSVASDHDAGVYALTRANVVPIKHQKAATPPDPFARCTYNGAPMDNKTMVAVQTLEAGALKDLAPLTIFQGCYSNGAVAASAGTHDGGGVLDFAPAFYGRKVKAWRELCGPAWHRPFNWDGIGGGEHIHAVMANEGRLSEAAAQQVTDYLHGENGLALHARDTNQYHPAPTYNYAAAWKALQG